MTPPQGATPTGDSDDAVARDVRRTIEQFFDAVDAQDVSLLRRVIAHDADMVHIGTDRGEIWRGWKDLRSSAVEQFDELRFYNATIRDLTIRTDSDETVAWYSHLLDADIGSEDGVQTWQGARFTGVLERRERGWVIVQTHVSLPESHPAE